MRTRKWRYDDDARELSVIREMNNEMPAAISTPFALPAGYYRLYDERSWQSIRKHAEIRRSAYVHLSVALPTIVHASQSII